MNLSIMKDKKILNKLLVIIFWIVVWEILYLLINRDIYLPSPYQVLMELRELVLIKSFWVSIIISINRVLLGFILSIIIGVTIGIISGFNKYIYDLIYPLIGAIKSTPVMSFIIIALIWFPSGRVPIFICFLMCFPIIWTNIVEGVRSVDNRLLEMAHIYRVRRLTILKKIYMPSITPYFSAASITALGLGWKVTVAAEVLSNPKYSIGANLYNAKIYLESGELFAWTFVVVALSLLFEKVFIRLIKKLTLKKVHQ